jgi:hypothetical protein
MFRGEAPVRPEIVREAYKALFLGSMLAVSGCGLLTLSICYFLDVSSVCYMGRHHFGVECHFLVSCIKWKIAELLQDATFG